MQHFLKLKTLCYMETEKTTTKNKKKKISSRNLYSLLVPSTFHTMTAEGKVAGAFTQVVDGGLSYTIMITKAKSLLCDFFKLLEQNNIFGNFHAIVNSPMLTVQEILTYSRHGYQLSLSNPKPQLSSRPEMILIDQFFWFIKNEYKRSLKTKDIMIMKEKRINFFMQTSFHNC